MKTLYAETIEKLFGELLNSRSPIAKDLLEYWLEKVEAKAKASALKKYRWEVYGPNTQDKMDAYVDEKITKFKKNILEIVDFKSANDVRVDITTSDTWYTLEDEWNRNIQVSCKNMGRHEFFTRVAKDIKDFYFENLSYNGNMSEVKEIRFAGKVIVCKPNFSTMTFSFYVDKGKESGSKICEISFPEWR